MAAVATPLTAATTTSVWAQCAHASAILPYGRQRDGGRGGPEVRWGESVLCKMRPCHNEFTVRAEKIGRVERADVPLRKCSKVADRREKLSLIITD